MIRIETINEAGQRLAKIIENELSSTPLAQDPDREAIVFIGALGICVRKIQDLICDKYTDPAVVCVDSTGKYAIPVLSGHVGGANELARHIALITGGEAVITTQSDNNGLWALDTIASEYGWQQSKLPRTLMNKAIAAFVNGRSTALVLECDDAGTQYMEQSCPSHVRIFRSFSDFRNVQDKASKKAMDTSKDGFELLVIVSPVQHASVGIPTIQYFPPCLHLGVGCQKLAPIGIAEQLIGEIKQAGYAPQSIATINSIELKKDEPLLAELCRLMPWTKLCIYSADVLSKIKIPNPSDKVFEVTGCYGVAESSAKAHDKHSMLVVEKQKGKYTIASGNEVGRISHYTYAMAMDAMVVRKGHIEIVGAGPGDPDLVSVRGRRFLEEADLILYAGSLVPRELTLCAKKGATVRSSANMDLEEQFALMKDFYDCGKQVVRLHTGDPCIYGAIQEQMAFFDQYEMDYHITPGISSFLAAAAELRSQFTIPERCQTIILTRGEGRTPMPEKEKLHLLAEHQSTMCIFLSASLAKQVQDELLAGGYPPETPVAACHKLTWKDQRIYRGQLKDLAQLMKDNKLTLTTMIVVGEAIDNRQGLSKLYDGHFTHLFREGKKE